MSNRNFVSNRITRWRGTLVAAIAIAVIGAAFHKAALRSLAMMLIVDEPISNVDLVLPYGGDKSYDVAGRMLARNEARAAIVFEDAGHNLVRFGILPPHHELARRELTKCGVPEAAIEVIAPDPSPDAYTFSSLETWMRQNGTVSICLITDRFNSRRIRGLLDLALSDSRAQRVCIVGLPDRRFDETNWWKSRTGIKSFVGSMLALMHSYAVGLQPPAKSNSWDPIEYERRLGESRQTAKGRRQRAVSRSRGARKSRIHSTLDSHSSLSSDGMTVYFH